MRVLPQADEFVATFLAEALSCLPQLEALRDRLRTACAIRLPDIIDHIAVRVGDRAQEVAGWRQAGRRLWAPPGTGHPPIVEETAPGIVLRVERLERILSALDIEAPIVGARFAPLRRVRLASTDSFWLDAIERNGWSDFDAPAAGPRKLRRAVVHQQIFRTRRRHFRGPEAAFQHTERLVEAAVADLGPLWACDLFLRAEREYWLSRCEAGVFQNRRQDRAGVGWCTIDHYVYCSSRAHFHAAISLFRKLGYQTDEIIRSDRQDECAIQVLRHASAAQPPVLIEVDLSSQAELLDAPPLPPLTWHAHAGLWCAMHGESLFEGGPSRLAARLDLDALTPLFHRDGVAFASPFPDAPELRQRLSFGQLQAVSPVRIDALERGGYLARSRAEALLTNGAVATHLQAVERAGFFDGFLAPDYADQAFGNALAKRPVGARPGGIMGRRPPVRMKRRR
jgi:hypothetical protein